MHSLPIVPAACSLGEDSLRGQLARYREAGRGAVVVEQSRRRLVVRVDAISNVVVKELVAVERRCCPFFDLSWEPEERLLSISVARADDEPALDAIAYALGLSDAEGDRR